MTEPHDGKRVFHDPASFLGALRKERAFRETAGLDTFSRFLGGYCHNPRRVSDALSASREYFASEVYLTLQDRADWQGVDPRLKQWAGHFGKAARALSIPLYAYQCAPTGRVSIRHSVYEVALSREEYQFLRQLGYHVGAALGHRLVASDLDGPAPDWWCLDGVESDHVYDPCNVERHTLVGLWRKYPAHKEAK